MQQRLVVGLDIGSSKMCVTVATLDDLGGARYVAHGSTPSDGMIAGEIVDAGAFSGALRLALEEAQRLGGGSVTDLYVSVAGVRFTPHERTGRLDHGAIAAFTRTDVMRALPDPGQHDARSQTTVHRVVKIVEIDGEEVDDPHGLRGRSLVVRTRDYTAPKSLVDAVTTAAEATGRRVQAIVPTGVASAAAALTEAERRLGVAVIDIGYTSTDIAVYCAGVLHGLTSVPIGGYHLSADLAQLLDIPIGDAERWKRVYGVVNPLQNPELDLGARTIAGWQRQAQHGDAPREAIQTIAGARLVQLFAEIGDWLKSQHFLESILAGVVLSGGGARLAGIEEVAHAVLGCEVRAGGVVAGDGFPAIPDPSVTASVGLVRYCVSRATRAAPRRPASRIEHRDSPYPATYDWHGGQEPVGGNRLIHNEERSDNRQWGRSVTRWMREFIPARGG